MIKSHHIAWAFVIAVVASVVGNYLYDRLRVNRTPFRVLPFPQQSA